MKDAEKWAEIKEHEEAIARLKREISNAKPSYFVWSETTWFVKCEWCEEVWEEPFDMDIEQGQSIHQKKKHPDTV